MALNIDSVNTDARDSGTWTSYEGSEFLIASLTSTRALAATKRINKPFERQIEKKSISIEQQRELSAKGMAEGVLLDWKNVIDGTGTEVEYSKEAATKVLMLDQDFQLFVIEFSSDLANYRNEEVEQTTKKPAKS